VVLPAMPSFYGKPATLDEALDTVVGRVLDHVGLEHDLLRRWGAK
jgi:4-hydroxy-3-polyprenylbenzoate decarboxylase